MTNFNFITCDDELTPEQLKTHEAMVDPQEGDRFHEMYQYWMYVVKVNRFHIWVVSASSPCKFPEDGMPKKFSKKDFVEFYSYDSKYKPKRYWIELADRGNDVKDWHIKCWRTIFGLKPNK